MEILDDHQH